MAKVRRSSILRTRCRVVRPANRRLAPPAVDGRPDELIHTVPDGTEFRKTVARHQSIQQRIDMLKAQINDELLESLA